jgi:predicted nucleic acid-binding Zn ribbon protein
MKYICHICSKTVSDKKAIKTGWSSYACSEKCVANINSWKHNKGIREFGKLMMYVILATIITMIIATSLALLLLGL